MYILLILIFAVIIILYFKSKKIQPKEKLKFIDLYKYNGKLFNDLANDSIQLGNNEKAIYYFSKAIELKPDNSEYKLNRGNLYWELGLTSLAIIDWESAQGLGSVKAVELLNKNQPVHQFKVQEKTALEIALNDFGIKYLYHMTHISNLENIIENGLLSHNVAHSKGFTQTDISDEKVNSRRNKVHDFVPFYFNPKNPMLYRRKNIQSEIIILCIDRNLLKGNLKFTDGNAASNSTKFYSEIKDLTNLNWSIINSVYWSDFIDGKRIRCSEILIPNKVETKYLSKIICNNPSTADIIRNKIKNQTIEIEINKDFYF